LEVGAEAAVLTANDYRRYWDSDQSICQYLVEKSQTCITQGHLREDEEEKAAEPV